MFKNHRHTFAIRLIVCGRQRVWDAVLWNAGISVDRWEAIVSQLLALSMQTI